MRLRQAAASLRQSSGGTFHDSLAAVTSLRRLVGTSTSDAQVACLEGSRGVIRLAGPDLVHFLQVGSNAIL